jgi:hypothetical protein
MRIHHPKHPTTAFWHAALFASVMITLWLLLTTLLAQPAHRAVTTEAGMPVRAAAMHSVSTHSLIQSTNDATLNLAV